MKLTVTQVRNYLDRLGVCIADGETIDLRTALPLNIAGRYDAIRSEIAGEKCIILFPRSEKTTGDSHRFFFGEPTASGFIATVHSPFSAVRITP